MLLRWNTPQYPRICPSTTTHCTHSAHENGLHHQAPLRCIPGPDQTKGPLCCARRPEAATTPTFKPRPSGDPGRSGAGAYKRVRFPPPDLWRPHRSSYNRYVRGRETAASRAKAATLTTLKRDPGKERIGHLDRQKLIDYGKMRADQGAGPVTLGIDIGVIKMIITHAAAVHGLDISPEPVDLARVALKRLGLIGKGTERDRRPTTDELNRLFRCFDDNDRLTLPMTRIVKFAVATAMRLDEICRVEWTDLDVDRRMLMIRDRKDPRNKTGNDQRIPLFAATGFDAWRGKTDAQLLRNISLAATL